MDSALLDDQTDRGAGAAKPPAEAAKTQQFEASGRETLHSPVAMTSARGRKRSLGARRKRD